MEGSRRARQRRSSARSPLGFFQNDVGVRARDAKAAHADAPRVPPRGHGAVSVQTRTFSSSQRNFGFGAEVQALCE
jgi:hypothetical protein